MWKRKKSAKSNGNHIPKSIATAIILASIALVTSAGIARWSWLLLDEQIELRKDLNDLELRQTQVETQYEFWLGQVQEDIDALN